MGRFSMPFGPSTRMNHSAGHRADTRPFSSTEQASQVLLFLSPYSSYQTGSEAFVDGVGLVASRSWPSRTPRLTFARCFTGFPHLVNVARDVSVKMLVQRRNTNSRARTQGLLAERMLSRSYNVQSTTQLLNITADLLSSPEFTRYQVLQLPATALVSPSSLPLSRDRLFGSCVLRSFSSFSFGSFAQTLRLHSLRLHWRPTPSHPCSTSHSARTESARSPKWVL